MIKNVVLDMGNVLLDFNPEAVMDQFCSSSEEKEVIRKELFNGPEWLMGDRGDIKDKDRFDLVKGRVPEKYHEALRNCADHWDVCMYPIKGAKEFCEYVKEHGYGIYVLSNASDLFYEYFPRLLPLSFFNGVFVSSDHLMLKPDVEIYQAFLAEYGLRADECLFIDDREENVEGAQKAGMNTFRFNGDYDEAISQLTKKKDSETDRSYIENKNGLGDTFDTVVSNYDKMRPGYVDALYQAIFDYVHIDADSRVVEVGSGSGQATEPILRTGCALTAVEYGENFSKFLMEKFKKYDKFSVITGKFEDVQLEEEAYDLVFSATAFHWVPEEIGYPKVFSILKKGGAFARFANRPCISQDMPELAQKINELYGEYYAKYYGLHSGTKTWFTEEKAKEISLLPEKYGFKDIRYHLFHRERVFSGSEYVQLLGTYSDHIAIEDKIRKEFFAKIEEAINEYGGKIIICDTLDLELARKV